MDKKVKLNSDSSVGLVKTKFFNFAEKPNELILSNGIKLGPITIAYQTYGELNSKKSIQSWYSMHCQGILMQQAITARMTLSQAGGIR